MLIPPHSEVKIGTGLGAYLKATADKRGPMPGSQAFDNRRNSKDDVAFKINAPLGTVVDINELLGYPAASGRRTDLGTGGDALPAKGREGSADGQDIETETLLTSCSTAVRRWSLLDRVQFLCRPEDPTERGPSVCGCGYPIPRQNLETVDDKVRFHVRRTDDGRLRAAVSGVYRCKSPWVCPVCAPAAARLRAERLCRAITACYKRGGHVALVTLTASHSAESTLADVKALIAGASSRARSGRAWATVVELHAILGVVVAPEATFSRARGPHYHQHLMVFSGGSVADAKAGADALAARYMKQIRAAGGRISGLHGVRVEVAADAAAAGEYAAKGSCAWEIAGSITKTDTKSNDSFTPWDIANLAYEGDPWARARWAEYATTMPGTRSCVITPSLKKALDLVDDDDEEEDGGEQQFLEQDAVVGELQSSTWRTLMKAHLAATFLARVEAAGTEVGFLSCAEWAEAQAAAAEDRIAIAKALREVSKARCKEADLARSRRAAIEYEARRLIDREGGRTQGRTIDAVRLAAENVAAMLPDVEPPSISKILAAMARVRDRRAAVA